MSSYPRVAFSKWNFETHKSNTSKLNFEEVLHPRQSAKN
jgi:hypothetical protein